jgi:hypothetical protein
MKGKEFIENIRMQTGELLNDDEMVLIDYICSNCTREGLPIANRWQPLKCKQRPLAEMQGVFIFTYP